MAAKALGYKEFIELAMKHYDKGGDGYVECWDERMFDDYVDSFGPITRSRALEMFHFYYSVDMDMAGW